MAPFTGTSRRGVFFSLFLSRQVPLIHHCCFSFQWSPEVLNPPKTQKVKLSEYPLRYLSRQQDCAGNITQNSASTFEVAHRGWPLDKTEGMTKLWGMTWSSGWQAKKSAACHGFSTWQQKDYGYWGCWRWTEGALSVRHPVIFLIITAEYCHQCRAEAFFGGKA